jgi:hypothetical protein
MAGKPNLEENYIKGYIFNGKKAMTKSEELYHKIAADIPDGKESKMFGALCIKAPNGKAGVMFHSDEMIFKLDGELEKEALGLKGAKVFAPGGRPMTGWIQIPVAHSAKWKKYAEAAMEQVKKIEVAPKKKK